MRSLRPSPALIDAALERYLAWRQASAAVRYTYGVWLRVGAEERGAAFTFYRAALDAEERAAEAYQASVQRAGAAHGA